MYPLAWDGLNDEIVIVLTNVKGILERSPSVLVTVVPSVYQFLVTPGLSHSNFTGWLRVGVIVIGVVGSSVLPTLIVLIADGLTI